MKKEQVGKQKKKKNKNVIICSVVSWKLAIVNDSVYTWFKNVLLLLKIKGKQKDYI